jgi:hypothetical protein
MGQSISNIGNQLTVVAISYQTYLLTRSTLMVGLIGPGPARAVAARVAIRGVDRRCE